MIERGAIHWADLGPAAGSRPAKRRPVLVIQADAYNASRLSTVLTAVITSNTALAAMPGNVFLPAAATGLPRDSAVNVTALATLDRGDLDDVAGHVPAALMQDVDRGLRRVLGL
ncbi:type II toxin-antitoxin system PemK/MazF family toxin [uncultured Modestobacter sp.]|uniref:type II toxin-antitoxin system PemK/MazF family toxin n=1 Tax=uncultured Modestobacter sp. TaxID=380048 RepID=UPI0026369352|nr:type II toxin-antitoxin system PemK/MazF family toxin [uncultured Modestobacter sp.]